MDFKADIDCGWQPECNFDTPVERTEPYTGIYGRNLDNMIRNEINYIFHNYLKINELKMLAHNKIRSCTRFSGCCNLWYYRSTNLYCTCCWIWNGCRNPSTCT